METSDRKNDALLPMEERRLHLEEMRLALDHSFARKWLPTLATIMVGAIAAMFSYVQQQASIEETKRARNEAKTNDEREWGFKVVEMYFNKREIFDLRKNPETAELNLRFLAAVAPKAVKGILDAEGTQIPPPTDLDDTVRINSLAAVAGVQEALAAANPSNEPPGRGFKPSDFRVYVQYAASDQDIGLLAQSALIDLGYSVPGIEKVGKVPSRLQVRYYRPEQKSHAGELAGKIGKMLGLPASADNAILVISRKQLPRGILELWLPHKAS